MIFGIGTDILDIRRIERLVFKFGEQFENKHFTVQERSFAHSRERYIETFAKMFSIKESVIKAISDVSGMRWHEIEVCHDSNGKPFINLSGRAHEYLFHKTNGRFKIDVSVSDEIPYVVSFVVISF